MKKKLLIGFFIFLIVFFALGWHFNRQAFPKENPFNPLIHSPLPGIFKILFLPTQPGWAVEGRVTKENTKDDWENPNVIILPDGRYRMYIANHATNEIVSAVSSDGKTFQSEPGVRSTNAGMPSVVQIGSNKWKMYFNRVAQSSKGTMEQVFQSAVSSNGLDWTVEPGNRLEPYGEFDRDGIVHPFVYQLSDGSWRMYFNGKLANQPYGAPPNSWISQIYSASSKDGLTWTKDPGIRIKANAAPLYAPYIGKMALIFDQGQYLLYFEDIASIAMARSTDGINFTADKQLVLSPGLSFFLPDRLPGAWSDVDAVKVDGGQRLYFHIFHKGIYSAFKRD